MDQEFKNRGSKSYSVKLTQEELVSAIEKISAGDIDKFVKEIEGVGTNQLSVSWFSIFEYQGFDPEKIIKKMIVLANHHNEGPSEMKADVMMCIAAYIYLGNLSNPKALTRRSDEGKKAVQQLQSKYQIVIGATGTGISPDTVTFPRIASAFPILTCRMASILPSNNFPSKPFKSSAVPKFMRQNSFASFVSPSIEERTARFILCAMCSYSTDLSIVYEEGKRQKKKDRTKMTEEEHEEMALQQMTFLDNARQSSVPSSDKKKKDMLREFKVIDLYKTLVPVVERFREIVTMEGATPTEAEYKSDLNAFISSSL